MRDIVGHLGVPATTAAALAGVPARGHSGLAARPEMHRSICAAACCHRKSTHDSTKLEVFWSPPLKADAEGIDTERIDA